MRVALEHERREGREHRDVSQEFLEYDIVFWGAEKTCYIEVKAFATTGLMELIPHEGQLARGWARTTGSVWWRML
jgi:hypothetical protein